MRYSPAKQKRVAKLHRKKTTSIAGIYEISFTNMLEREKHRVDMNIDLTPFVIRGSRVSNRLFCKELVGRSIVHDSIVQRESSQSLIAQSLFVSQPQSDPHPDFFVKERERFQIIEPA